MKQLKIFRYIIPLSFVVLLFANVFALSLATTPNIFHDISNVSSLKEGYSSGETPSEIPKNKIGELIIDGETNLTTDKEKYNPGESVTITADSKYNDMNGSLEWRLESPIGEIPFDFYSDLQKVFQDPNFNNLSIPDWTNGSTEPFDFVESTSGYLNLTATADGDENDNEIYFYNATVPKDGKRYLISFDYFSKGENILDNPGFEGGITTGWYNSSFFTAKNDPNNASEGNWYLEVNGTAKYLLQQNVTSGFTSGRYVTLSAKGTGNTAADFWSLRIEAYNSSGNLLGQASSVYDSTALTTDKKGYVFNKILNWQIPNDTNHLRVNFIGDDTSGDGLYTGWVDDFCLAEIPPALMFSYWGESDQWENITINGGNHEWEQTPQNGFIFDVSDNVTESGLKTFRFLLNDESVFTNITTAYWLIDNITLNEVTKTKPETLLSTVRNTGSINSTWTHRGYEEVLLSNFDIKVEDATPNSSVQAMITVEIPSHQVYFGSWIFMLTIHREGVIPEDQTKRINISFIVEEPMNYVPQDIYMLRGSTNVTVGNDSIYTDYFEQETDIEAISPGDNVTVLGYLEANSTQSEWYDLEYLLISSATVEYTWYSNWGSKENITWIEPFFIVYDEKGESVLDGNFSTPFNNIKSLGFNFVIPDRGIFGNLNATLSLTLANTNPKPNNVGGTPLTLDISLNLPPVRFGVNVTNENLPASSYYLTDFVDGNISVELLNVKTNLTDIYPSRNITSNISVPYKDLDLSILIGNESGAMIELHHIIIGNNILWLDDIYPNFGTGLYEFWIRWNVPYKQGITDYERINITAHTIIVQGTLEIPAITTIPKIVQGGSKTFNFTVQLSETGKLIRGLNLKSVIVGTESNETLIVYEEDDVYKIDVEVAFDSEVKQYTIQIFIPGSTNYLTEIKYEVIELTQETDRVELTDVIVTIGGLAFFLVLGIGVSGVLFIANKRIK